MMRVWHGLAIIALALAQPVMAGEIGADIAADIIREINRLRADPPAYARELRAYRDRFDGRLAIDDIGGRKFTREGVAAVDEAIAALERQAPLARIDPSALLATAAQGHADEQGPPGLIGHQSISGATPGQRIAARGGGANVWEAITYGGNSAAAVVRQLVVDDGVPDRGHRKTLLLGRLRYAGAGCAPHKVYAVMCVMDFGQTIDGR